MSEPNLDIPTRMGWLWLAGAWVVVAVYSAAWVLVGYLMCGGVVR